MKNAGTHVDNLMIAGGFVNADETKLIHSEGCEDVPLLNSNHEEADTRMILHAIYANDQFKLKEVQGRIIIKSPDTDVLVLAIHHFPKMSNTSELWIETGRVTGTTDLRRYIPVHVICQSMLSVTCEILPAVHALSGCDSTSSFFGIGKRSVTKAVLEAPNDFAKLSIFGNRDVDETEEISAARHFVKALYDPTGKFKAATDLNDLRVKMSRHVHSINKMPPCEASFRHHSKRASWQTRVWKAAHIPWQEVGSPTDNGWIKAETKLVPKYFDGPMVSEVLEDLICFCKGRNLCGNNCSCHQLKLQCTVLCPCFGSEECCNEHTQQTNNSDLTQTEIL